MDNYDTIDSVNKDHKVQSNLDYYELTEKDFYPPEDTRLYYSGIEDINGGDNFSDYAKFFFNNYGKEIFDY